MRSSGRIPSRHRPQRRQAVTAACAAGPTARRLAIALCLLAGALPLTAQQTTGVLVGTVTSAGDDRLAAAHVAIAGSPLTATTGRDGRFRIEGVPAGAVMVEVSLMGYQAATMSLDVLAGLTATLDVVLELDPVRLEALHGRGDAVLSPELRGFYDRRERGGGHYFTRDDIDRLQARLVTDVLRRVPGVRIEPMTGPMGSGYTVRMDRATGIAGAKGCPVLYYVNGMPFSIAAEIGINPYIRPDEISAMEVYSGASQLPPQFHVSPRNARCGVVVIWTQSGERRRER